MPVKKLFTFLTGILFASSIMISSCKKDNLTTAATVIDGGVQAADGCGWLIQINSTDSTYSPVNLPDAYKTNGLKVLISYTKLGTIFQCGILPSVGPKQIKLGGIKKQ